MLAVGGGWWPRPQTKDKRLDVPGFGVAPAAPRTTSIDVLGFGAAAAAPGED